MIELGFLSVFDVIREEAAKGTLDEVNRKTIQPVSRTFSDGDLPAAVNRVQAIVDEMRSGSLSPLDKPLTTRDLMQEGLLGLQFGNTIIGGAAGLLLTAPGVVGFNGTFTAPTSPDDPATFLGFPYLAVPPAPTNLQVHSTIKHLILTWDLIRYQNHGFVQVYRSTTNNVATATLSGVSTSDIYVDEVSLALGTTYYYWVRAVSNDATPATGPYNSNSGTSGAVGTVGTSDLGAAIVLAGNLAPGSVTADKAALEIGGDNLCPNNSFEQDSNADGVADNWGAYGTATALSRVAGRISGYAQRVTWTGANTDTKGVYVASNPARGQFLVGKTYVISWYSRANAATPGLGMELEWSTPPATTVTIKNPALSVNWQRYAYRIVWGASVDPNMFLSISYAGNQPAGWVDFDDVQVEEGDTLTGYTGKLALNTIVAGDGAIGNLAITNALVGNAAIDTAQIADLAVGTAKIADAAITNTQIYNATIQYAKIASVDAATISVGFLAAARIAAGSIDATKISVSQLSALSANMGTLTAGSVHGGFFHSGGYTNAFAWPAAGLNGFHLSPSGLLIGNYNDGKYFEVTANGDLYAPGLSIVSGSAIFSGALSGATGSFSGSLSAATGSFAGTLTTNALKVAGSSIFAPAFSEANTPISTVIFDLNWHTMGLTTASIDPGATGKVMILVHIDWAATVGPSDIGGGGDA